MATFELCICLSLSVVTIMVCGVFTECPSVLYDDFYEIPFYIIVKIQLDMIFGWLNLHQIFDVILHNTITDLSNVATKEQKIERIFRLVTYAFWLLLLS